MGADCMRTSSKDVYKKYFQKLKIADLKSSWKTVELYKIRKIFDSYSKRQQSTHKETLSIQSFKEIFSEFYRYEDKQIQRIYQIFDYSKEGCVDWNNFFTTITICHKAPPEILSVLMFMIFDESLAKKLNKDQLNLMIDLNSNYILKNSNNQAFIYDPQEIVQILLQNGQDFVTIDKWQTQSLKLFNFQSYKNFFNIFVEVKLERELMHNFDLWNEIFNQGQNKYISYVIDFKWFELWKAYTFASEGIRINTGLKNPNNTMKTFQSMKSKKNLKTHHSIKTENKLATKSLITFQIEHQNQKMIEISSQQKNYNLIHSNIGSKPLKMFNQELEGQFLEVLAPELVENMNYALVSEKIWKRLKLIYFGYPQFRRTGPNNIQLYPKRVKIYSSLFREKLDYSSEIIREVPCYTTIQTLFQQSLDTCLLEKAVFFKTIGMGKWQELFDFTHMFADLTSQILVFMTYFDSNEAAVFRKNHCKIAQSILQVNLGDEIRYDHPQKTQLKKAIYMGQTEDGKQIVHFKGSSHIYDQYVSLTEFHQKATLIHRNSSPLEEIKISSSDIPIIPIIKSYGFINSLILSLITNPEMKNIMSQYPQSESRELIDFLSNIYKQSKKKSRIDINFIVDLVETNLSDFVNFEFGMIDDCYRILMETLDKNLRKTQLRNAIRENYYFVSLKKVKCLNCNDHTVYNQKCYSLNIELPENQEKYFEFTFVPFSSTLKSVDIKKFGLKMKSTSTYKQYKAQITKLTESEGQPFVICQVYGNDIIRNFFQVKDETTLEELNVKQTDNIVVYQLSTSLNKFVIDHYTQVKDITHKKIKKGDFVDCKVQNDKWVVGKVVEYQFKPYTQTTIIQIVDKETIGKDQKKQYELTADNIAVFPTKSYLYGQQYHLKVLQRCYNEALNEMLPSNLPLVIVLADWMRCKEFQFMVYQQLKIFIAQNYRFKDVQSFEDEECMATPNAKFFSYKFTKQQKVKRFKQYLCSDHFPYTISLLDLDGRCLLCHKIQKTVIKKGQSDYYCCGCKLSNEMPISWQIKPKNCMICIDWHGFDRFKKNIHKDHKSFTDMIMNKKNDIERLDKLIEQKFTKKVIVVEQQCCNFQYRTQFVEELKSYPSQLVIQIQRLVDNGVNKSINRKHINFPFDDLTVGNKLYQLTGVISIEGTNKISYKNYISNESDEWFQVYGETIKKVKKNIVQKCCALFLMYKMKELQQNQGKLSDCRQSEEFFASEQQNSSSNMLNSEGSVRKTNKKQLTINQRLQNMDYQEDGFSYLDTEKQDKVQHENEELQSSLSDSDIPPERSNSKRSAKYVKDSKQLIKSVSQCGKSSQDQKENIVFIHLEKSNSKPLRSLKKSQSASSFEGDQTRKTKIKFQLIQGSSESSENSEEQIRREQKSQKRLNTLKKESSNTKKISSANNCRSSSNSEKQIVNFKTFELCFKDQSNSEKKLKHIDQDSSKSIELQKMSDKVSETMLGAQ